MVPGSCIFADCDVRGSHQLTLASLAEYFYEPVELDNKRQSLHRATAKWNLVGCHGPTEIPERHEGNTWRCKRRGRGGKVSDWDVSRRHWGSKKGSDICLVYLSVKGVNITAMQV